jgi:hypothetical protein
VIYKTRAEKFLLIAQRDHRINAHCPPCGNPHSADSHCNERENVLNNLEHHKGRCRNHALACSGIGLFISWRTDFYGTIAATWLEYKLSLLLASTAVTT